MIEFLCKTRKGKTFHYMVRPEDILDVQELSSGNARISLKWRFFSFRTWDVLITVDSYEDVRKRIEQVYPLKIIEKN